MRRSSGSSPLADAAASPGDRLVPRVAGFAYRCSSGMTTNRTGTPSKERRGAVSVAARSMGPSCCSGRTATTISSAGNVARASRIASSTFGSPASRLGGLTRKLIGGAVGDRLRLGKSSFVVREPVEHALPYDGDDDLDRVGGADVGAQHVCFRVLDCGHYQHVSGRRHDERIPAVRLRSRRWTAGRISDQSRRPSHRRTRVRSRNIGTLLHPTLPSQTWPLLARSGALIAVSSARLGWRCQGQAWCRGWGRAGARDSSRRASPQG